MQAGTVGSHPQQKERELEELVNRNPYQQALLRMHQAQYQPQPHQQLALLQVRSLCAPASKMLARNAQSKHSCVHCKVHAYIRTVVMTLVALRICSVDYKFSAVFAEPPADVMRQC